MKKIRVKTTFQTDIIGVPDSIEYEIDSYLEEFLHWVEGRSFVEGLEGTVFGTENFVEYLNQYVLNEHWEKACLYQCNNKPIGEEERKAANKMKMIYI